MKALILAAGLGTRLLPITEEIPKCLVRVNDVSMLEFWLQKLNTKSITSILVNTHHFADKVKKEIHEVLIDKEIQIFHEESLLGTAGTLSAIARLNPSSELLVVHSDNFSEIVMEDFLNAHNERNKNCSITIAIFKTNNIQMSGMVEIDGDGVVRDFTEKPVFSNLTMANAAVYAFDLDAIQEILIKHTFANDIARDILPHFLGRIQTFEIQGFHMDMGTMENLNLVRNRFEVPQ